MNFVFVNYSSRSKVVDYTWMSLKTYVEDNYKGSVNWHWSYPIHDSRADSIDQLVEEILEQNPTVVGFAAYVWNIGLTRAVAARLKELRPDVYITFGGPFSEYKEDPNYFINNPYIDFTCETDGYGEPFINELLYRIETDKDWSKVPFLIMKREGGYTRFASYAKRMFVWPRKIYERNEDYLKKVLSEPYSIPAMVVYETHRGCPYSCSFCEWSGGTNTKVSFKPTDMIYEDIRWLITNSYLETLHLVEANFGQLDRDVELIKEICELSRKTGYPKAVNIYGLSKSKKKNVYEIDSLLVEHGLAIDLKISLQDLDDDVLRNINRVDEPWQNQFEEYMKIRDKFGVLLKAEMIRGLPGVTLDTYYDSINEICKRNIYAQRYQWHLLPTSPAADKGYMEKHKLDVIDIPFNVITNDTYSNINEVYVTKDNRLINDDRYAITPKIVVGTYSYTREDYAEMTVMDSIINVMEIEGYLSTITKYMNSVGVPYGTFYRRFYRTFKDSKNLHPIQSSTLNGIILQTLDKVQEKTQHLDFEYYEIAGIPWKIRAKIPTFVNIMININRDLFFDAIHRWIVEEFGDYEKLSDAVLWSKHNVKWIDYEPNSGWSFKTEYDWTTDNSEKGCYVNTPLDTTYTVEKTPITWHKYDMKQRVLQYFIPLCSANSDKKTFNQMKVVRC
jgi:putative methyltransferase